MKSESYRPATPSDLDGIMAVEHDAFDPAIWEPRETFAERLSVFPEGFFVSTSGGIVDGYVCSERWDRMPPLDARDFKLGHSIRDRHRPEGEVLYVSSFGIRSMKRGTGSGSRLWNEFERYASEAINPSAWILIVARTWTGARNIYETSGFSAEGTLPSFFVFKDASREDAIVMSKKTKAMRDETA